MTIIIIIVAIKFVNLHGTTMFKEWQKEDYPK